MQETLQGWVDGLGFGYPLTTRETNLGHRLRKELGAGFNVFKSFLKYLLILGVFARMHACMYACMHAKCLQRSEGG